MIVELNYNYDRKINDVKQNYKLELVICYLHFQNKTLNMEIF